MVRSKRLMTAVAFALVFPALASAETLSDALAKAYANNPDLNAARAALRAADEGVPIAKSGYRPQVGAQILRTTQVIDSDGSPRR